MTAIIVYHYPCADGLASAWVTKQYLEGDHDQIVLIPANYDRAYRRELDERIEGITIRDGKEPDLFFVDFSDVYIEMLRLEKLVNSLTIIDHHKTAQAELEGKIWGENTQVVFDMAESGATLTYMTFFDANPKAVPKLLQYIKDRDIWEWKLPGSREVNEVVFLHIGSMEEFSCFAASFDEKQAICDGAVINRMRGVQVKQALKYEHVLEVAVPDPEMGSVFIPAVNAAHFHSDVGHALAELHPEADFVAVYTIFDGREVKVSLRVRQDHDFDASVVAKFNGGGGHAKACGFGFPIEDLPLRVSGSG